MIWPRLVIASFNCPCGLDLNNPNQCVYHKGRPVRQKGRQNETDLPCRQEMDNGQDRIVGRTFYVNEECDTISSQAASRSRIRVPGSFSSLSKATTCTSNQKNNNSQLQLF